MTAAVNVYEAFPPNGGLAVKIPKWATKANIIGWISSVYLAWTEATYGDLRVAIVGQGATFATTYDETARGGSSGDLTRYTYNVGGSIDIPDAIRGTTQTFRLEGRRFGAYPSLKADSRTANFVRIRFEEAPI